MRLLGCLVLAMVAVLVPTGPGAAQARRPSAAPGAPERTAEDTRDAEARDLYQAGRTAFDAGRYEAALRYFREAHALSGRPELLFNIGTAADRLRLDAEALDAFERFIEAVPDSPLRPQIEARVAVLREAVARAESAPSPQEVARAAGTDSGSSEDALARDTDTPRRRMALWVGISTGVAVVALAFGLGFGLAGRSNGPDVDVSFATLRGTP